MLHNRKTKLNALVFKLAAMALMSVAISFAFNIQTSSVKAALLSTETGWKNTSLPAEFTAYVFASSGANKDGGTNGTAEGAIGNQLLTSTYYQYINIGTPQVGNGQTVGWAEWTGEGSQDRATYIGYWSESTPTTTQLSAVCAVEGGTTDIVKYIFDYAYNNGTTSKIIGWGKAWHNSSETVAALATDFATSNTSYGTGSNINRLIFQLKNAASSGDIGSVSTNVIGYSMTSAQTYVANRIGASAWGNKLKINAADAFYVGGADTWIIKTANTYTFNYNGNGTATTGYSKRGGSAAVSYSAIVGPLRTGYQFTSWTITGSGTDTTKSYSDGKTISTSTLNSFMLGSIYYRNLFANDMTFTANWTPCIYTITLDNQGGTGDTAVYQKYATGVYDSYTIGSTVSTGVYYNGTVGTQLTASVACTIPTKTGYVFGGYYTATNGTGTQMFNSTGYLTAGFTTTTYAGVGTLYAKWIPISYLVTLNDNSGSGGSGSLYQNYGVGYYKTLTSGTSCGTNMWYGGTLTTNVTTSANAVAIPTRTGYIFNGYYTASTGGVQVISSTGYLTASATTTLNTAATTWYAQWTAITYTVAYNGNGSTGGSTASSSHTYAVAKALTSNGFTKTGYTFAGWATSSSGAVVHTDGQSVSNLSSTNAATVTLYAKWTANSYTISYNGNGNTGGSTASSTHNYDASQALTANGFTRTGYVFAGWATSAGGAVVYSNSQSILNLTAVNGTTITLYAKWTAITYTVTYNGNGNTSGSMSASTHTYDVAKALTANAFVRRWYSFTGWNTAADGSGTSYSNSASVTNLTSTNGANINLYAQWTKLNNIVYTATAYDGYYTKASHSVTINVTTSTAYTIYYSTTNALDETNYSSAGSTTVPTRTSAGNTNVYFAIIPNADNTYYPVFGSSYIKVTSLDKDVTVIVDSTSLKETDTDYILLDINSDDYIVSGGYNRLKALYTGKLDVYNSYVVKQTTDSNGNVTLVAGDTYYIAVPKDVILNNIKAGIEVDVYDSSGVIVSSRILTLNYQWLFDID